MRDKEIVGLYSAYLNIHSNLNEEVEELDESGLSQGTIRRAVKERQRRVDAAYAKDTPQGDAEGNAGMKKLARSKRQLKINEPREVRMRANEEVDIFDTILEHLVAEGYADTNESALAIMANMSEEWRQDIMEISRKTATSAFAKSATGEFEGADSDHDIKRTKNLGKHIERKFGKKALEDAERHADSTTFGRIDPRTGKRQPKPQSRFQTPNKYRTTKDGKMHGQDQNKLKAKLKRRMGEP